MSVRRLGAFAAVAAACLADLGCNAFLGLDREPDGIDHGGSSSVVAGSTTGAASASSASAGASTAVVSSSSGGGAGTGGDQGGAAPGGGGPGGGGHGGDGGDGGTGPGGSGGAGGSGGEGGSPSPVCDAPEPEAVSCGLCSDLGCERCDATNTICTLRTITIPDTSRVTESVGGILNRFGRGLVAAPDFIAFTRTRSADDAHVVTVVRTDDWVATDATPSLDYAVSSIAGDPFGQTVVVTSVEASPPAILALVDPTKEQPLVAPLEFSPPVQGFGAITWDESTFFVGVGRSDASFYHFDTTLPNAPCLFTTAEQGGTGVAVAPRSTGGFVQFLAPVFDAEVATVSRADRPAELCPVATPEGPSDASASVAQVNGVASSCGRTIVQTVRPGGAGGRAFRMDDPTKLFTTYPSQAIAAANDRVYLARPDGGVARCDGDLAGCVERSVGSQSGVVSVIAATANGFVSVGFSDEGQAAASAIVTCGDDAP